VTAAGGTCAFQVIFTPTAAGTRTGALTITDNSAGSPRTVQLTGLGGQAASMLSPSTLSFTQAINTTGTSPVTLTNSGALPLQISTIQISGATFSETNNCGSSVGAGQSCQISVSFAPTTVGNFTGTLTVTDSAPGSPQTVPLTGKGVADSVGLGYAPNSGLSSSTTPAGSVAITTIQVGGAGMSGTVNFSCSGLPQGATCAFSPSTVTMKPTVPTQVQITISTTARSLLFMPVGVITPLLLLAILIGLTYFKATSMHLTPRLRWRLVPLFALAICACGGGSGNSPSGGSSSSNGTPAGTSTVVITATSGSSIQTLNFKLTVN
jgi:Abnormal spindle-like microcephaly-assoc'd, ASPM-SPD-2-Hydin